ncbi:hypothetical protein [Echinicola rosea]|uniref:Uncharacterized protein n=1 Tax=Echinicola rosea TaxID=1807691 RepID=A0ABQ1UPV3_9BACT|nr:hypothetical protein [Echinicola rosea]GGF22204.1 hypothetical protein GCM10011339_07900 [Echinicola rosea]
MKRYLLLLTAFLLQQLAFGQLIERNFFGDLEYHSRNGEYKATLEKNVFNDLMFSDNKHNKITFEEQYLHWEYGDLLKNEREEHMFLMDLVRQYRRESHYKATYQIDIFDNLVIEDNRDYKLEVGQDIFGNITHEESINGRRVAITREKDGGLIYESNRQKASLQKDIFDRWIYEDSQNNKLIFSNASWANLARKYGNNERIFQHFMNELLFIQKNHQSRPRRGRNN